MAIKELTTDKKVVRSILWVNLPELNENNLVFNYQILIFL